MTRRLRLASSQEKAFTLLELMTVIVILLILATMATSGWAVLSKRAERAKCVNNLGVLYAAASSYLADKESWPQIPTVDMEGPTFARSWIAAFKPYSLGQENWLCPTVQKGLGNPTLTEEYPRVDYFSTPYDNKPSSPRKWPTQPWFIERANSHGDGNMLIYANGQIRSLNEARRDAKSGENPFK